MDGASCMNCKFWIRNDDEDFDGECRRYPPKQLAFNVPYPDLGSGANLDRSVMRLATSGEQEKQR